MDKKVDLDLAAAHKYFAATCFNQAWDYIDKPSRTPEDDLAMILTSLASLWHWTQRPDCTAENLSVGYWQVSRVSALAGQAENARRYAEWSLRAIQGEDSGPFYLAYAYEALARAEMVSGNRAQMIEYLEKASQVSKRIEDEDAKKMVLDDLATVQ